MSQRSPHTIHTSVVAFPVRTPTLPPATHTNIYIVGVDQLTIIDIASPYPEEQNRFIEYIKDRVQQGATVERIVLTHHHQDHISGVPAFLDHFPVPVCAHPNNHELLPFEIDHELNDGDELRIKSSPSLLSMWQVLHTPGHASGHICLVNHEISIGIVGDMLASEGSILIHPQEGHMRTYLQQLQRLQRLHLAYLLPSHGNVITQSEQLIDRYIKHRLMREQKILQHLPLVSTDESFIGLSLKEIVILAYDDAIEAVKTGPKGGLAGLSAHAHLIKLVEDCHVIRITDEKKVDRWHRIVPLFKEPSTHEPHMIDRFDQVMTTLRAKCPWDAKQTLYSLQRYLLEESYEVLDALQNEQDWQSHRDELGDLLLQIVFQSKIREEQGSFKLYDVIQSIYDKMIRRHPHVFDQQVDLTPQQASQQWQAIKAQEKKSKGQPHHPKLLDDVPKSIPALLKAQLLGERAARVGFEWPDLQGPLDKVVEEYQEVLQAIESESQEHITAEIGDLLFSIVNVCRHLKISPETALQKSNYSFYQRFSYIESRLKENQQSWETMKLEDLEAYWQEAKHFYH